MAQTMKWFKVTCSSGVGVVLKGKSVEAAVSRGAKELMIKPGTQPKRIGKRGNADLWSVRRMLAGAPVREVLDVEVFDAYGAAWLSVAQEGGEEVKGEKFRKKRTG